MHSSLNVKGHNKIVDLIFYCINRLEIPGIYYHIRNMISRIKRRMTYKMTKEKTYITHINTIMFLGKSTIAEAIFVCLLA